MIKDNIFKKVFSHFFEELGIPNLAISIQRSDFENLQKAHQTIHEFIYLATQIINADADFYAKSAFLYYHSEIFDQAHRSLLEALTGYYNSAYTLLRSTLELLIRGAFWECFAHRKYRDKADVVKKTGRKINKSKKTLIDWVNEIVIIRPSIEGELETFSASIFDKTSPLFEDETLKKIIPNVKSIIEQLAGWNIFDPILDPTHYIYSFYKELSADVHVIPDKTNIGKRLFAEKELYETAVIPEDLNKYAETLHKVIDIGIVVELNILEDIITKNENSIKWLRKELLKMKNLRLNYTSSKILKITK
ncbi:hypothetical protein ES703_47008 [subsurface metagenome]